MLLQRSTDAVRAPRRFDFWRDAICETFVDLDPRPRDRADDRPFSGELVGGQIGDVRLCTVVASPHEVIRSPGLIRRTGGDFLFVSLLLAGNIVYAQDDRVAELVEPGQFVFYDSARPYMAAFRQPSRQLVIRFPRERLSCWLCRPETLTARTIGASNGTGGLASRLLRSLAEHVHDVEPAVADPVLDTTLGVLAAALGPHDGGEAGERRVAQSFHLQRAHESIRRRHHDPGLSPAAVARDVGVSERYLFALFREHGLTPAKAILNERLSRAHRALSHPTLRDRTVEGLALRLGFKNAAHFTRAFKDRYGVTPTQHRRQARPVPATSA